MYGSFNIILSLSLSLYIYIYIKVLFLLVFKVLKLFNSILSVKLSFTTTVKTLQFSTLS